MWVGGSDRARASHAVFLALTARWRPSRHRSSVDRRTPQRLAPLSFRGPQSPVLDDVVVPADDEESGDDCPPEEPDGLGVPVESVDV